MAAQSMRGIMAPVNDIRKKVYAEVARLSYEYEEGSLAEMEQIPYKIIPGEVSKYRDSVFLERAIVKERMRLAMGLPLRDVSEHAPVSTGAEECVKPEKYYQPPLINIIKFACNACPDNEIQVTEGCQGCLAHPCQEVCPRKAISFRHGRSRIDQSKCIKCGKCVNVCPYEAIIRLKRPCSEACGMKAISSDELGRAEINQENCVSCGQCMANCPFGAISDKAQIFQTIQAIRSEEPVYAAIAPAVAGQFGDKLTPEKIRVAFKELGFEDAVEVAIGADLCTIEEAEMYLKEVPTEIPFMATSCCPAWSAMAKRVFPDEAKCISMALTPMVLTGRMLKKQHPGCKVAFIGPCSAKKLEASRRSVRSDIDFVLTFEEVMGMFEAKNVDFEKLEEFDAMHGASADGRGFAVSGGVAQAVANYIKENHPEVGEVPMHVAENLEECRKMMMLAKRGQYNGYLLEGMACPGGCIAGVGTVQPLAKSVAAVNLHKKVSTNQRAHQSDYQDMLEELEEDLFEVKE